MNMKDMNCAYCAEGALVDAFGTDLRTALEKMRADVAADCLPDLGAEG